MLHPTNPDGEVTVTDEKWDAERLDAAIQDFATVVIMAQKPEHGGMRKELKQTRERIHEIARLLPATQPAAVDREAVEEGCTPADARVLRAANHALADENDKLRRALAPFARLVSTHNLSWAMVEYCVEGDPEKQTFRQPQMQRAFNRAAAAYEKCAAAPLDQDASKPADYSQCCDSSALCSSVRRCTAKDAAAPSVEQDERGACEASLLELDVLLAKFHEAVWDAAENGIIAYDNAGRQECKDIQRRVRKLIRAASTSANVAQGAEKYKEFLQWFREHYRFIFSAGTERHAEKIWNAVASPAQTMLTVTPAMVKAAMPWLTGLHHMRKTDKESNVEEAIKAALTAAQSASGDAK